MFIYSGFYETRRSIERAKICFSTLVKSTDVDLERGRIVRNRQSETSQQLLVSFA